jgi:hypothetical protein
MAPMWHQNGGNWIPSHDIIGKHFGSDPKLFLIVMINKYLVQISLIISH